MTQLLQRYLVDDRKYDRMLMTNDIEGAKPRRFIKDYKEAFHSYLESINSRSKSEKKEIIIKNASNIININNNANVNSPPKIKQKLYYFYFARNIYFKTGRIMEPQQQNVFMTKKRDLFS